MQRFAAVVAFLAVFASCDPGPGWGGSARFSYTGAVAGDFSAAGSQNSDITRPQAFAMSDCGDGGIAVFAYGRRGSAIDGALIEVPCGVTGSLTPVETCSTFNSTTCGSFTFTRGASSSGNYELRCHLGAGTIVVTESTDNRVAGTFSGTGTCAAQGSQTTESFSATNGEFAVAVRRHPGT